MKYDSSLHFIESFDLATSLLSLIFVLIKCSSRAASSSMNTVKVLNFQIPKIYMYAVITVKYKEVYPKICRKGADGMENGGDPDQTAPLLGAVRCQSALFAWPIGLKTLDHFGSFFTDYIKSNQIKLE